MSLTLKPYNVNNLGSVETMHANVASVVAGGRSFVFQGGESCKNINPFLEMLGPVIGGGCILKKSGDDLWEGLKSIYSRDLEGIRDTLLYGISDILSGVYNITGALKGLKNLGIVTFIPTGCLPIIGFLSSGYVAIEAYMNAKGCYRIRKLKGRVQKTLDDKNPDNLQQLLEDLNSHSGSWLKRRGISSKYQKLIAIHLRDGNENKSQSCEKNALLVKSLIERINKQQHWKVVGLVAHMVGLASIISLTAGTFVANPMIGIGLLALGGTAGLIGTGISGYLFYYNWKELKIPDMKIKLPSAIAA
ncbi:MAG: hypothetical protein ACQEP8_03740 [Chlamydiota bacterium]